MFTTAQIVTETNATGQAVTAAITAVVGLVAVLTNAHSGSLRKAERLTELASRMANSSERGLVENLRDDYATSWALSQMAPTHNVMRVISFVTYGFAGLAFLVWWAYSTSTQYAPWTWWIYVLAIVLLGIAYSAQERRRTLRARWIRQERAHRWMRLPQHTRLRKAIQDEA